MIIWEKDGDKLGCGCVSPRGSYGLKEGTHLILFWKMLMNWWYFGRRMDIKEYVVVSALGAAMAQTGGSFGKFIHDSGWLNDDNLGEGCRSMTTWLCHTKGQIRPQKVKSHANFIHDSVWWIDDRLGEVRIDMKAWFVRPRVRYISKEGNHLQKIIHDSG